MFTKALRFHRKEIPALYIRPFLLTVFRGLNAAVILIYGILIARQLGPAGFGSYSYWMVLVILCGTIADMGTDRVLVREIAIHPEAWQQRWRVAAFIRAVAGAGILLFSSLWMGAIGLFGGLAVLFGTLARSLESVMMAQGRAGTVGGGSASSGDTSCHGRSHGFRIWRGD